MIAIIKTGGKQYKVKEKDILRVEKLPKAKDGKIVFADVLLVSDGKDKTTVGQPIVSGAKVEATIIRDGKAKKIRVVKYKAKVRYKRTIGHRQQFSEIRIEKITA